MASKFIGFFASGIKNPYLLAALLSVVPVSEIKGSILYSATTGANLYLAFLFAYLASLPLIALQSILFPRLFEKVSRYFGRRSIFLTDRIAKTADKLLRRAKDKEDRNERLFLGVFTFVGIPLPMTGIWAGALLSAMLGLDVKRTFFALAAGNFTTGGIVLAIALVAGSKASFALDVFCLVVILFVLSALGKHLIEERRHARKRKRGKKKRKGASSKESAVWQE